MEMKHYRHEWFLLLLAIGLIAMLFGCGGDGRQLHQKPPTEKSSSYQLPPLPLPDQAIRLSEQIVKQRERSATRSISYNRQAAVDYALNHWNLVRENEDPNKDGYFEPKAYPESLHDTNFRVFKNNCTAFISQCLWAGGVPFYGINLPAKELDYFLAYNWWYDRWEDKRPSIDGVDSRQTHSWVNANTFAWFMFLRIGQAVNSIAKLQPGDVISIDFQGSLIPDVDHSVIVIGNLPNGDVVCAANTESRNDLTMAEIFRKFPDANIWAWHIDSNYIASPDSEPPDLVIDQPESESDDTGVPTNSSTSSNSSSSTPDPTDTTPPTMSWAKIDVLGNDRFNLVAEFADTSSGVDKNRFWLEDPAYSWHQIGNWNFDNPSTLPVDLNGQELVGNWKFFVEGFDKSGNHLDRTDTGRAIGWGAPWIEDQSMEGPSSTGQSIYRAQFDSFAGHDDIDWSELFYWVGDRYYRIGGRVSGYQARWDINPLDHSNMEKGHVYPLTLIIQGTNGVKADMVPAGYYLTVPDVLIPLERGKESLVKFEPDSTVSWHVNDTYFATSGWNGPHGPNNFNVDLKIYVEGTQHHSSTEHCPVVWGFKGNGASYKVMGSWGYGFWLHLVGNINDLPTGLHAIGAEMKWDGKTTGPIRAKDSWIWVDNDHPLFDKIVEGPASGSVIYKSQNTELCIRTTMQDVGGSGTAEYWLALVGQGEERGFKERIYGYTGINHCTLAGLPNGQYRLYVSYSRDQVGNAQTRSIPTDVTFEVVD